MYVTVERPSVLPSVCPIDDSNSGDGFDVERTARNSNGAAARRSAANAGSCHVDSQQMRLNTDLYVTTDRVSGKVLQSVVSVSYTAEYRYFASIAANRIITSRYSTCNHKPHRYCSVANNVEFNDCHAASTYCRLANVLTLSMLSMSTANKSSQVCFLTSALSRGANWRWRPMHLIQTFTWVVLEYTSRTAHWSVHPFLLLGFTTARRTEPRSGNEHKLEVD